MHAKNQIPKRACLGTISARLVHVRKDLDPGRMEHIGLYIRRQERCESLEGVILVVFCCVRDRRRRGHHNDVQRYSQERPSRPIAGRHSLQLLVLMQYSVIFGVERVAVEMSGSHE